MSTVVRVAVLGLVLTCSAVPAAKAQDTGTYRSGPLDWGQTAGAAWVDFNADGKADFCRIDASARPLCTLATGRGFGVTIVGDPYDAGYGDDRLWGDVDGSGGADYCRKVGDTGREGFVCTPSAGTAFLPVLTGQQLTWGTTLTAVLADVNGDGKKDYCRLTADRALCSSAESSGFGPGFSSAPLDIGAADGRAFVDQNGDGKADFCRVIGSTLACTLSTGTGFSSTISSPALDVGYPAARTWADINGDGRADYCRRVGGGEAATQMSCTLSGPTGFESTIGSGPIEWGTVAGTAWVDFNGDGNRDFCRPVVASATNQQLFCTLWTPSGFGQTIVSGPTDVGYETDRAWVDHNGDGKIDYCRRVGGGADPGISCTTSLGTAFGPIPEPAPPAAPAPAPVPTPAPTSAPKKTRLVVTLSWDHRVIGRWTHLTRLQVKGVPAGATVKVTCKQGCSSKSYSVTKHKRGTVSLMRMAKKRLKAGTIIRVVVSRPGNLAAIKTLRIRTSKPPQVKTG